MTHLWTFKTGLALVADLVRTLEFSAVVSAWPVEDQLDQCWVLNFALPGSL